MLRIYDEFLEDETVQSLKDRAYRLHVSALIYCSRNLTDGDLSDRAVKVLQVVLGYQVKRWVAALVEAELWLPADDGDGFRIRNYLEFNPPASVVKKERAASRERMRKLREKRAGSDEPSPEGDAEHSPERSGAVQPSPVPPIESSKAFGRIDIDEGLWKRLLVATGARDRTSVDKLVRTVAANRCGAGAVTCAIEAATGPGVVDPLAVALSELKKRRAA